MKEKKRRPFGRCPEGLFESMGESMGTVLFDSLSSQKGEIPQTGENAGFMFFCCRVVRFFLYTHRIPFQYDSFMNGIGKKRE